MKIKILRQKNPKTQPYWESFNYDGTLNISVAGMLDVLNFGDDIINDSGEKTDRIGWECACLQSVCGACAMVINETPALACETFLKDLNCSELVLRPLRKFPVVHDLIVNRSIIHDNLKDSDVYIGEYQPRKQKSHDHQYTVAKCLKCGLCLEVCPNYTTGRTFYGPVYANDCYFVSARSDRDHANIRSSYEKHFASSCSKTLACMDICPVNIKTLASMAKLNRKGRQL